MPHNELASLENAIARPTVVISGQSLTSSLSCYSPGYDRGARAPITPASTSRCRYWCPSFRRVISPILSFLRPNLVGELQLRALIGADGLVKDVTVLSGDPRLAEVGMRAVRQWHYAPYEVLGSPVEVETRDQDEFLRRRRSLGCFGCPGPASHLADCVRPHLTRPATHRQAKRLIRAPRPANTSSLCSQPSFVYRCYMRTSVRSTLPF